MTLKHTPLHQSHLDRNAKMGEFAGYDMPLYYDLGVKGEHLWTREKAGLFDVSHMGQIMLSGPGVIEYLERITPSSFAKKAIGRAQYTVLTNEQGGMVDDLIVTRMDEDRFFVVVNAGCKDKDIAWMRSHLPDNVEMKIMDDRGLLALQGPHAENVLNNVLKADFSEMPYMTAIETTAPCGSDVIISRLGYTGEDGFEISAPDTGKPHSGVLMAWDLIINDDHVEAIGLAARDSLRLEMGYPLYGHDIDDTTSPIEAGTAWIMGKNNTGFIGADNVLNHKENGVSRRRVGIKLTGRGVAREGAEIRNANDEKIGTLTSGGFSPSLESSIGMGYITEDLPEGAALFVNVRGRNIEAEITVIPFLAPKTKSMKKKAA